MCLAPILPLKVIFKKIYFIGNLEYVINYLIEVDNSPANANLSMRCSLLNTIRHFTEHSEYGGEQESYNPSVNLYFSKMAEQIAIKPNK